MISGRRRRRWSGWDVRKRIVGFDFCVVIVLELCGKVGSCFMMVVWGMWVLGGWRGECGLELRESRCCRRVF